MLSYRKWARTGLAALIVVALLSGGLVWAKPPKPPPEPPPPPPVTYAITWLDTLGGDSAEVYDLNDFGDVVGLSNLTPGDYETYHAYLNLAGQNGTREVIDLNDLIDDPDCVLLAATAINNVGQIIGAAEVKVNGEWVTASFRYTLGSTSPLENLGTVLGKSLRQHDINDQGVVVGDWPLPFRYTDHMEPLENLVAPASPWIFKTALRIDNSGRIVGEGVINGETHAYRLTPGLTPETSVVEDLGFLDGAPGDMSDVGHVVGWFVAKRRGRSAFEHACLLTPFGNMMDLGVLPDGDRSYGTGVNNLGQVAGTGNVGTGARPFLYLDEYGMLNMDDLLDATANSEETLLLWHLLTHHWGSSATGGGRINNPRLPDGSLDEQGYGQIIGWGWSDITGSDECYLLTPVPPPPTE